MFVDSEKQDSHSSLLAERTERMKLWEESKKNKMTNTMKQEIKDRIIKYCESNEPGYAIMIDGEWGCGKTYFIEHDIVPSESTQQNDDVNKDKYELIRISLYGIDSITELDNEIEKKCFQQFIMEVRPCHYSLEKEV